MMPTSNPHFHWQGRVDSQEVGPCKRWHQHIQQLHTAAQGGVRLIGFAVDEGVRRNSARVGAAQGPHALRSALASLPLLGEPALYDAGDVVCEDQDLEGAQARLADHVARAVASQSLPVVLGGGHEMAWGTFQGVAQQLPRDKRLLIVNLDAHFDLRADAQGNSGTPFRQIHDWCESQSLPFNYRVFGISRFANTQALFERADSLGVRYWLDEELQDRSSMQPVQQALATDLKACDAVYLSVCLDALPGGQAPGVSAPAPLGVPLSLIELLIDQILASQRLIAADIAELNPLHDRDGLTARVAARLVARIARGAPPSSFPD